MLKGQTKVYHMLCRVQEFVHTHAARLGRIAESAAAREVDVLVSGMRDGDQDALTSRATKAGQLANTRVLRRALWVNHLRQIAAIARAELRHVPQFEALLLPTLGVASATLVQWARAMAAVAQEHVAVFVSHGLPAEFVAELQAAADALDASLAAQIGNGRETVGAREQVAASRSRSQFVVRVLNAQIEKALVDDPALLAQWRHAKRVGVRGAPVGAEVGAVPAAGQTATVQSAGTGTLAGPASTNTGTSAAAGTPPLAVVGPDSAQQPGALAA